MQKIIFDTDIGDDIDDALALALAVKMGIEIVGVTTVYRNTQLRARQAKRLLSLMGKADIPVYAGYGNSLVCNNGVNDSFVQYTPELEQDCYRSENPDEGAAGESAVDFMIEMAETHGKDLTIVCIGALTNLARALRKNRAAIQKAGRIVMMGGCYTWARPEWNIRCDPEAAAIVMKAPIPKYCVGLDVTLQCEMSTEQTNRMLAGKEGIQAYLSQILGLFLGIGQRPRDENRRPIMHDPLALYTVAKDDLVEFEPRAVRVELENPERRAITYTEPIDDLSDVTAFIYAATTVKSEEFKEKYLEYVFD